MSYIEKVVGDTEEADAAKEARISIESEHKQDLHRLRLFLLFAFAVWLLWTIGLFRIPHVFMTSPSANSEAGRGAAGTKNVKILKDQDKTPTRTELSAEFGQSGDLYGGANALFAAIAGALVAWAGHLQSKTLRKTQEALNQDRRQGRRDQFEATFFIALGLLKDRIRTIRTRPIVKKRPRRLIRTKDEAWTAPVKVGPDALEAFAAAVSNGAQHFISDDQKYTWKILLSHFQELYGRRSSDLGPVFRLLEQIFRLISESDLNTGQKGFFARLARDELRDASVLLLALYGMTYEGRNIRRYIVDFRLLENMLMMYVEMYGGPNMLGSCYPAGSFRQTMGFGIYADDREGKLIALTHMDFSSDMRYFNEIHMPVFDDIGMDFDFFE